MHLRSTARRLGGVSFAAALVGATLTIAPAAHAAPVFDDADTNLVAFSYAAEDNGAPCEVAETGGDDGDVPVVENGPTATTSSSVSATYEDTDADPADTATASGSATGSAKVTSVGGVLKTIDFSATSNYTLNNPNAAASDCYRYGYAGVNFSFEFTIAQAGWLILDLQNRGTSYGEVDIDMVTPSGNAPDFQIDSDGLKFNNKGAQVFLPAGTYEGFFQSESGAENQSVSQTGTTTVHGEFVLPGSQTSAPEGKGGKYVKFPASRNCAAHTLTPTVTEKGKRAKKIQSVKFYVNDKLVKKVRNPSKGEAVAVPIADDVDADVLAKVKLEKVKKGVPAKKFEVRSSYIACS